MSAQVLVAGGGVGGLSAAIHAALHGFEVTLYEAHSLGGKAAQIHEHGYTLDPGPSIVILPEIYQELFRRAGRNPDDYLKFERLDPITRVFLEGREQWVDIPASWDECIALTKTWSSRDAESLSAIGELLARVEPHIERSVFSQPIHSPLELLQPHLLAAGSRFATSGSYKQYVDARFESPLLRAFFYGFPAYSGQTYHTRSMAGLLIPYYMLKRGVYYPTGGVGSIPLALERLARELGVVVHTGACVKSIELKKDRVCAVTLSSGEVEKCDYLISNIDRLTTERMLGRTVNLHPSFSYFTVHWGIRKPLPNLSHHMLLIPAGFESGFSDLYDRRVFPDPPITYLNATSHLDPSVAPAGHTNLFAVVGTPACEPHLDWSDPAPYVKVLHDQLAAFGWPLKREDVVFERVQTPAYFQERHGNFLGSLYGPVESERLFGGLFPLKCKDDRVPNLFYAGGSVQPGAGLPMVTLSGKFAADAVARRHGRRR